MRMPQYSSAFSPRAKPLVFMYAIWVVERAVWRVGSWKALPWMLGGVRREVWENVGTYSVTFGRAARDMAEVEVVVRVRIVIL